MRSTMPPQRPSLTASTWRRIELIFNEDVEHFWDMLSINWTEDGKLFLWFCTHQCMNGNIWGLFKKGLGRQCTTLTTESSVSEKPAKTQGRCYILSHKDAKWNADGIEGSSSCKTMVPFPVAMAQSGGKTMRMEVVLTFDCSYQRECYWHCAHKLCCTLFFFPSFFRKDFCNYIDETLLMRKVVIQSCKINDLKWNPLIFVTGQFSSNPWGRSLEYHLPPIYLTVDYTISSKERGAGCK